MLATVPHVTSGLGLRTFQADGFLATHVYIRLGGLQGRTGRVRKISSPTGIRSSDRPARSESIYRLRYTGQMKIFNLKKYYGHIR